MSFTSCCGLSMDSIIHKHIKMHNFSPCPSLVGHRSWALSYLVDAIYFSHLQTTGALIYVYMYIYIAEKECAPFLPLVSPLYSDALSDYALSKNKRNNGYVWIRLVCTTFTYSSNNLCSPNHTVSKREISMNHDRYKRKEKEKKKEDVIEREGKRRCDRERRKKKMW